MANSQKMKTELPPL